MANGVGKGLSEVTEDGFTFTVQSEVANQVDLLATAYQAGNTATSSGGSVNLVFHHLLSRVGFKVQSTTSKAVKITSLTFTGDMPTQGTLDFDAAVGNGAIPELQPTAVGTPTYNCITGTTAAVTSGRVPGTEYLMIMPHIAGAEYDNINTDELKGSDHKVNVTYTIGDSTQERESTVTLPIGFEFIAGKAYEIVLKISTSSLSFDVQEEDWNTNNGNNAEINPNEPPVPEEDEEDEEEPLVTVASIEYSYATLSVSNLYATSARFNLFAKTNDYKDYGEVPAIEFSGITMGGVDVDDKEIGFAIRKKVNSPSSWTICHTIPSAIKDRNYIFVYDNLEANTVYECCIYTNSRTFTINYKSAFLIGQYPDSVTYDPWNPVYQTSQIITFITPSEIIYPSFVIDDVNSTDIVKESDDQFQVSLRGKYTLGTIDGDPIKIKEYGFCWKIGAEEPTLMDEKKAWTVASGATSASYDLSHTIQNLRPNTTYSYCAYVIAAEDRTAYETSPSIAQEKVTITHEDEIIYSPVYTFTTGAIVNNNDNTDGSWGSSDGDTEFKPKR